MNPGESDPVCDRKVETQTGPTTSWADRTLRRRSNPIQLPADGMHRADSPTLERRLAVLVFRTGANHSRCD